MTLVSRLLLTALLAAPQPVVGAPPDDPAAPPPQASRVATSEPVSLTVAMSGIVVVGAGFGMMLHQTSCGYASSTGGGIVVGACGSDPGWLVGGVVVVAAGVTMTWLGLRSRTVLIAPTLTPRVLGATATIRWGGSRPPPNGQRTYSHVMTSHRRH